MYRASHAVLLSGQAASYGLYARLRIELSEFKPWPTTLYCGLEEDTLHVLSQCPSPPIRLYKWVLANLMLCATGW